MHITDRTSVVSKTCLRLLDYLTDGLMSKGRYQLCKEEKEEGGKREEEEEKKAKRYVNLPNVNIKMLLTK